MAVLPARRALLVGGVYMKGTTLIQLEEEMSQAPTQEAPVTTPATAPSADASASAPAGPSPEERKSNLKRDIEAKQKEMSSISLTLDLLTKEAERTGEEAYRLSAETMRTQRTAIERTIERLERDLENVDRDEAAKKVAGPLVQFLGKSKIRFAHLLPATVDLVGLEKMKSDATTALQRSTAMLDLVTALEKAGEKLDEDAIASLPPLAVNRNGEEVSFAISERRTRRASSNGTGTRASAKSVRIVKSDVAEHVGMIIGKADGASFPSWQALYESFADDATRQRLDSQSRSKREWYTETYNAEFEEIAS